MKKLLFLFWLACMGTANAQVNYLTAEAAIPLSNRAETGYLAEVETNDETRQIDLYFVTATKARKIKVEKYSLDYDLNLKNSEKLEYEREKMKSSYNWFKMDKEFEVITGITAEANMSGKLVLRKKEVTRYWNWFTGSYQYSTKTLDKLKPKDENDKKMYYHTHFDNNKTGNVVVLVSEQNARDYGVMFSKYRVLSYNQDLDVIKTTDLTFDHPQYIISRHRFASEDPTGGDFALVFAPLKMMGIKNEDPDPQSYTYVRISPNGEVKDKIRFTTRATKWRIEPIHEAPDGSVILFGPGKKIEKPGDAYANYKVYDPAKMEKGFDNFQLVSIANGAVEYVSAPTLAEMEEASMAPARQKKIIPYEGKRLIISDVKKAANGDVVISGQMIRNNIANGTISYKDFVVFHYGPDGGLKKVYTIDTPAKGGLYNTTDPNASPGTYPSYTSIELSGDGKSAFWLTGLVMKVDQPVDISSSHGIDGSVTTTRTEYWVPREQLLISRINLDAGTMEEVQIAGEDGKGKKDFYLRSDIRHVSFNNGKSRLIIGEDRYSLGFTKKDNYIYLGKIEGF